MPQAFSQINKNLTQFSCHLRHETTIFCVKFGADFKNLFEIAEILNSYEKGPKITFKRTCSKSQVSSDSGREGLAWLL